MDTLPLLYIVSLTCDVRSLRMPSPLYIVSLVTHNHYLMDKNCHEYPLLYIMSLTCDVRSLWIPSPLYITSLTCDARSLFNGQELLWRHAIDNDFCLTTGEPCRERTQQMDHLERV